MDDILDTDRKRFVRLLDQMIDLCRSEESRHNMTLPMKVLSKKIVNYQRKIWGDKVTARSHFLVIEERNELTSNARLVFVIGGNPLEMDAQSVLGDGICLLYTSPSPRDRTRSRMPSSA